MLPDVGCHQQLYASESGKQMFHFLFLGSLRNERLKKGSGFTEPFGSDKAVHPSGQALGIVMRREC